MTKNQIITGVKNLVWELIDIIEFSQFFYDLYLIFIFFSQCFFKVLVFCLERYDLFQ